MTNPIPNQAFQAFPRLDTPLGTTPDGSPVMISQGWQWLFISIWQRLGGSLPTLPKSTVTVQQPGKPLIITDAATGQPIGTMIDSIEVTAPIEFIVTGGGTPSDPIIELAWANENANEAFMGPASGPAAVPTFRALVPADIPIDNSTIVVNGSHIVALAQRHIYAPCIVSALPAGVQGDEGFVSDSTQTLAAGLGTAVVGGGGDETPVYRDSVGWKIG